MINLVKRESKNNMSKNLQNTLLTNKNQHFWKIWNSNFKKNAHLSNGVCINNIKDCHVLSDLFAKKFQSSCSPNDRDFNSRMKSEVLNNLKFENLDELPIIEVKDVDSAINKVGLHSTPGHDSIVGEHFKFAHPSIIIILSKILNICLHSGILPDSLCLGITTPIPKFKGQKRMPLLMIIEVSLLIHLSQKSLKCAFSPICLLFKQVIDSLALKQKRHFRCYT